MRIALIFKRLSLHGGSERQLAMLAANLSERGHEVHVFCAGVRTRMPSEVILHVMPPLPLGSLVKLLVFSAWARAAVARHEREHGPFDVRHAFGRTRGQDVYRVGGGCHPTYLQHAHALDRPAWLRRLLRRTPLQVMKASIEKQALLGPPAPWVVTNSTMTRDDLLFRYGLQPDRTRVVRNGVDLDRFRPATPQERIELRHHWKLGADAQVALFLGTGYARKGLEPTLRAMRLLSDSHPRLHLVVAGHNRRMRYWHGLAERFQIADRIRWLGRQRHPELCYRVADVFILPTAYDPAANSTLEALATGIPVITSSMDGAAEIMDDGLHGTVLPTPVHPTEIAAALRRWLDVGDRAEVIAGCRARAEDYPVSRSCDKMLEVYGYLLAERATTNGAVA